MVKIPIRTGRTGPFGLLRGNTNTKKQVAAGVYTTATVNQKETVHLLCQVVSLGLFP